MSTTATRIGAISLVCLPTTDVDRSIEFYESLGFEKRTDVPFGGEYRWVEVTRRTAPPASRWRPRRRARTSGRTRPASS